MHGRWLVTFIQAVNVFLATPVIVSVLRLACDLDSKGVVASHFPRNDPAE